MSTTKMNTKAVREKGAILGSLVAVSDVMRATLADAEALANSPSALLIDGEAGSGKKLLARATHEMSFRRNQPVALLHAASLTPDNLKSVLYGDITTGRVGRLEAAGEGTLLIDGLEDLSALAQEHLSSIIQENRYKTAFGETRSLSCKIVSTADRGKLEELVRRMAFSPGLYNALSIENIRMPSLSERTADIPGLSMYILDEMADREKISHPTVPYHYLELLMQVAWPENVRQLRNHIESVMVLSEGRFDPEIIRQHFLEEMPQATIAGTVQTIWKKFFGTTGETVAAAVKSR